MRGRVVHISMLISVFQMKRTLLVKNVEKNSAYTSKCFPSRSASTRSAIKAAHSVQSLSSSVILDLSSRERLYQCLHQPDLVFLPWSSFRASKAFNHSRTRIGVTLRAWENTDCWIPQSATEKELKWSEIVTNFSNPAFNDEPITLGKFCSHSLLDKGRTDPPTREPRIRKRWKG